MFEPFLKPERKHTACSNNEMLSIYMIIQWK